MHKAVTPQDNPIGQARILLSDDDPRLLESLRILLELYDYQVETALGGQNTIDKLATREYDLILLDLKMPILDGFGVLAQVKGSAALRHTPIVVLTSSTEPSDLMRAYAAGTNAYMAKPTDFGEFLGAMKHLCWLF